MSVFWTFEYELESQPMTHSRILYDPIEGFATASTFEDGYEAENATKPDTYSFWRPTQVPGEWILTFAEDHMVDCVGIGSHQLGGGDVSVDTWTGTEWKTEITATPEQSTAIMLLFKAVNTSRVRVRVYAANAVVGVIYVGRAMALPVPEYMSLGQIDLRRVTEFRNNQSEGGNIMGRSIARVSLRGSYSWKHISEPWYRANADAFSKRAREIPFFLAARPDGYETEVAYGLVNADIQPDRMGIRNLVSFGFEMVGYSRV